jgi:hypothetical protein
VEIIKNNPFFSPIPTHNNTANKASSFFGENIFQNHQNNIDPLILEVVGRA